MSENRCVCCGTVIPEGSQVCPLCMRKYEVDAKSGKKAKRIMRFEDVMNDWVYPILLLIAIVVFIVFVNTKF